MLLTQTQKDKLLEAARDAAAGAITANNATLLEEIKQMLDTVEKRAEERVAARIEELFGAVVKAEADIESKIEQKAQALFEAALAADRQKRYDSNEPFVEIVSQTFSEEGGVQLRLDWNKPFIDYLKKNGFTGPTEETIVDNWLVSLSRDRIAEGGSEFK